MMLANQLGTLAGRPDIEIEGVQGESPVSTDGRKNKDHTDSLADFAEPDPVSNDFEKIIELSDSIVTIPECGIPARDIIKDLESNLIRAALIQMEGNVSKAAELLTMGRTSVIQKISKYNIKID
jgi:DNA-binding NtrC family response regulator